MLDEATEGVAEHSSRLQPSIKFHAPAVTAFMFSCSGTSKGWRIGWAMCSDRSLIVYLIRTRAAGFQIISGDHYTIIAHVL